LENNIHAGTKYLRFLRDRYLDAEEMDLVNKNFFAVASYHAGAEHVARLRRKAARVGLDPNRWFQNVEVVAAREMGVGTAQYVSNIAKYYAAYRRLRQIPSYGSAQE
jgi:membrane-bound lytic murein transglycosylase MltF